MGFNKVIRLGNLTRSPELKYSPTGTAICNFGLAVNRKYKQGEELKDLLLLAALERSTGRSDRKFVRKYLKL